ncbi:MAG: methylase involved in ubiquinone/menaquinone biosynthesis [Candidatus Eremiobacteraeota bacterium]|nr:methylase involved in ubiquinone/menaquinone biosynthesis [Candidatus Eremiobacteraeota bacterium]
MGAAGRANIDDAVVEGFGDEWSRFDQSALVGEEYERGFNSYFHIFPWNALPHDAIGFDLGCGSGRWARGVAPRVGTLVCVDASSAALSVARRALAPFSNVRFHHASVDNLPFADESMDFGYSLGVLHHVPDTLAGLQHATAKLKRGAPFLLYLYYRFDNQPSWYRALWKASETARFAVSRSPLRVRYVLSQVLAALVYYPLARLALLLEKLGMNVQSAPLSGYRHFSFYTMRTDALDRFGTRLEQRFTRAEMQEMMERAGLRDVRFSESVPYWCAVGIRA